MAPADSVTGATKWQPREGGRVSLRPAAPKSCHSPGGGRARGRGHAPPRGSQGGEWPPAGEPWLRECAGCSVGWPEATRLSKNAEEAGLRATRASVGEEKKSQRDKDFWREVGEHGVVAVGVAMVTGGPDVAILGCDRPHACPQEARSLVGVSLQCGGAFPRGEELHKGSEAFPTRDRVSEAPRRSEWPKYTHDLPEVAWREPRSPGPPPTRKRKER